MIRAFTRFMLGNLGYELRKKHFDSTRSWFDEPSSLPARLEKASSIHGRFREIISDPLNTLIERDPFAGAVYGGFVKLHTGLIVPVGSDAAYYGNFSDILVINRGVHEPLEEFVFQELVRSIHPSPVMLELGAYWGHYSMWMKQSRRRSQVFLVEPEQGNLKVGEENFRRNQLAGTFIKDTVGHGHFEVDRFLSDHNIEHLDVLHSDIQGAEVSMLEDCKLSLSGGKISYCFVSTHSQQLHSEVERILQSANYRIEASADVDHQTTSHDGMIFAAHANAPVILEGFNYLGREEICTAAPAQIIATLNAYAKSSRMQRSDHR